MKGTPRRAGEIVDLICREAGIKERVVPRSTSLHKQEAASILGLIQGLQSRLKGEEGSSEHDKQVRSL